MGGGSFGFLLWAGMHLIVGWLVVLLVSSGIENRSTQYQYLLGQGVIVTIVIRSDV